jgi:hypothetical protein
VVLAVALAFSRSGWWPFAWAMGCILVQGSILALGTRRNPVLRAKRREGGRIAVLSTHSPEYLYDAALHSSWWRATTADALMIGRQAHGYVVWRHSARSGLHRLLSDAALSDHPANLLAMLHSGAAAQSLTFALFREPPEEWWAEQGDVKQVKLEFDQLAPTEDLFGVVNIFVGVPSSLEPLAMAAHPLTTVLKVVAEHQPVVIEAQMPVPPPSEAWTGLRCAWIRVGFRDPDMPSLADFLHTLGQLAWPPDRYVVAATTVSSTEPRILSGQLPTRVGPTAPVVLASDLDVVTAAGPQAEGEEAQDWRVMALCANYRGNIESQIVTKVGPDLRLAGVTYALLQGKAVMLLLGYQPGRAAGLSQAPPDTNLKVVLNDRQTRTDLGVASPEPLLWARVRSPNRPGTTLHILDALEFALKEECELGPDKWHVWHARTVVTAENLALNRFILRLSVEPQVIAQWGPAKYEEIEQQVRAKLTSNPAGPGHQADRSGAPEELLVRVEPVTTPKPHPVLVEGSA